MKKQILVFLSPVLLLCPPADIFQNNIYLSNTGFTSNGCLSTSSHNDVAAEVYKKVDWCAHLPVAKTVFMKAYSGYLSFKEKGVFSKQLLSIIDFSLSSAKKRLWVIDLSTNKLLYFTYVAHGKNSGEEFAQYFSNEINSNKSSLGFFATAESYYGANGLSLRIDGLEKGKNDQARVRAIVIHGADYVSENFIRQNGRLGRSQGCPAVPREFAKELIQVLKNKSCLFIYHPNVDTGKPASQVWIFDFISRYIK